MWLLLSQYFFLAFFINIPFLTPCDFHNCFPFLLLFNIFLNFKSPGNKGCNSRQWTWEDDLTLCSRCFDMYRSWEIFLKPTSKQGIFKILPHEHQECFIRGVCSICCSVTISSCIYVSPDHVLKQWLNLDNKMLGLVIILFKMSNIPSLKISLNNFHLWEKGGRQRLGFLSFFYGWSRVFGWLSFPIHNKHAKWWKHFLEIVLRQNKQSLNFMSLFSYDIKLGISCFFVPLDCLNSLLLCFYVLLLVIFILSKFQYDKLI